MGNNLNTLMTQFASLSVSYLFLAIVSQSLPAAAKDPFKRTDCATNITKEYQNPNGMRWDSSIIYSVANVSEPVLTLYGCEKLCGSGTGWYPDSGPRLVGWLLPIFLLISNMQFPRIREGRFFLVLHLLGDPIDSTWSLLYKIDNWRRCYARAREQLDDDVAKADIESLAMIYAALMEVENASYSQLAQTDIENMALITTTANELTRQRTNEIMRTGFAVTMYMFQVVSDFVPAVGASSDPSGGMIGPAMLLSWLVPVVLLSNAIGDSGSPDTALEIMVKFTAHNETSITIDATVTSRFSLRLLGIPWNGWKSEVPRDAALAWFGASPSFQSQKGVRDGGWILAIASVVPVILAFGIAFTALEAGPTYFSCRSLFVIGASLGWVLSAVLTYALTRNCVQSRLATGQYLWRTILVKDFLVATPILVLIVATSCGYWDTCYCWCGGPVSGDNALCPLKPTKTFSFNDGKWYPATVAAGLGLQVMIFLIVFGLGRHGFMAMGLRFASFDWLIGLWRKSSISTEI